MEDGSYKTLSTEEVYNNMNKDYANKDIINLLEVNYSEADGKLYIKVKWHTGEGTLIHDQALKASEPVRLADFLPLNPVEKLRSGYWNEWAKKTAKNITVPFGDFTTCMTTMGPLMFRISPLGKLDECAKELRPRSIRRE